MPDNTTDILIAISRDIGEIKAKIDSMATHHERIGKLELFNGKIGAYIWMAGAIATGALYLLAEGLKYFVSLWSHH